MSVDVEKAHPTLRGFGLAPRQAGVKVNTGGPPSVGVHLSFTRWPIFSESKFAVDEVGQQRDALVQRHIADGVGHRACSGA